MVNRKIENIILFFSLISIIISLVCFTFCFIIGIDKTFIFLITVILVLLSYGLLIAFFYLHKIFTDIKSEFKILNTKESAVRDIYRYDQFLNPPDIDN
jgi:hypothetical protein